MVDVFERLYNPRAGLTDDDAPPPYSKLDLDAVEPTDVDRFSGLDVADNVMVWLGLWLAKLYLENDECLSSLDKAGNVLVWSGVWLYLMVVCVQFGELGPILFPLFYPAVAAVPLIKVLY